MIALEPGLRRELTRWGLCGAVVIALHGGLAAAVMLWPDDSAPAGAASVVMMELAPLAQEAAAIVAPVEPRLTIAAALPSATSVAARTTEASLRSRAEWTGSSSLPIHSVVDTTSTPAFRDGARSRPPCAARS